MTIANLPALSLSPEDNLRQYLADIGKFSILDREEEYMLAKRWQSHQDQEAARRLVVSHLRLVAKIASKYRGYGLPYAELISEGNVGLMLAVKRFEPERGFRLSTYAVWWIRSTIQEYILRSWSLVRIGTTAAQKKLFFNLKRLKANLRLIDEGKLSAENIRSIAEELDVREIDVVEMNKRLSGRDASLNVQINADADTEWQDWLADNDPNPEQAFVETDERTKMLDLLRKAMTILKPREREIIRRRRLSETPDTLDTLSRERVRQIETKAFEKLQKHIKFEIRKNALARHPG